MAHGESSLPPVSVLSFPAGASPPLLLSPVESAESDLLLFDPSDPPCPDALLNWFSAVVSVVSLLLLLSPLLSLLLIILLIAAMLLLQC